MRRGEAGTGERGERLCLIFLLFTIYFLPLSYILQLLSLLP